MNSPNRYSEDDLDHLVRGALQARVSGQEPPDHVWGRIKADVEASNDPPPRLRQTRWSPLVVQAALTLLLVVVGGIGLQTLRSPVDIRYPTRAPLPSATTANVEEQSVSPALVMVDDEAQLRSLSAPVPAVSSFAQWAEVDDQAELRSLRTPPKPSAAHPIDNEPASQPAVWVPPDAPPNVFSPEGRALLAELSWPPPVEEQSGPRSGAYPWFR